MRYYVSMQNVGPEYHNSHEKHEFNARVAKALRPAAFVLLYHARNILSTIYGPSIFFTQSRHGEEVWKMQTLDRSDYDSPEDALQARIRARKYSGVRIVQDLACDELLQAFQVSLEPNKPTGVSIVAIRTIMDSDNDTMRRSIGKVRHNEWQEITAEMGHGVFSAYGSFSHEARSQPLNHTSDQWMERYTMDMWQYYHASVEVDTAILNGTIVLGAMRSYMLDHGHLPDEAKPLLHDLGMLP